MPAVILVVDKFANHRQMIRFAVQLSGRQVLEAETEEQALSLMEGGKIELLIAGCNMTNTNCLEQLRRLCRFSRNETLPVVITSHNRVTFNDLGGLPIGSFAWVQKPFRFADIQRAVDQVLSNYRDVELHGDGEESPDAG